MVYEIPSDKNTQKSIILENISILTEYQKLIDRFFSAISANAEGKSLDRSPVDIMKDIVELDKKMQQVEEHQRIHHKILQVENEINAENNAIVDFVNYLRKGKEQIDDFLESSRNTMRAIELATNVTADEILKYANRISKYTAAPPGYDLTRPTELQVEPPHPIEAIMRKGLLFRQEYLGMNFGEDAMLPHAEEFNLDLNPELE
ncbi:8623_t:CDS:2 [Diversispora eburnea]|uniref:Mediator of RNA polymerase II transcription subunit 4 n=1 Tax=Diversispora eburnea TaxID=1213867 RepID=A0A9N9BKV1_9GLOM|nr:8623_t:CDS:2 [Diversispora eburnea]